MTVRPKCLDDASVSQQELKPSHYLAFTSTEPIGCNLNKHLPGVRIPESASTQRRERPKQKKTEELRGLESRRRGGGRGQEGDLHAVTSSEVAVDEVLVAEVLHSPRDVGHELYQHLGGKVLQDRQRRSR